VQKLILHPGDDFHPGQSSCGIAIGVKTMKQPTEPIAVVRDPTNVKIWSWHTVCSCVSLHENVSNDGTS
jgi:hypothetical protein